VPDLWIFWRSCKIKMRNNRIVDDWLRLKRKILLQENSQIAEWLTTKLSSAPSATVEDKYRGTILPKACFQTFPLRVIPT
jgi:hypothetical protein